MKILHKDYGKLSPEKERVHPMKKNAGHGSGVGKECCAARHGILTGSAVGSPRAQRSM
jgi:hypothetical protein